jgi:hypothetical protein
LNRKEPAIFRERFGELVEEYRMAVQLAGVQHSPALLEKIAEIMDAEPVEREDGEA